MSDLLGVVLAMATVIGPLLLAFFLIGKYLEPRKRSRLPPKKTVAEVTHPPTHERRQPPRS
jgi:hypothetical protein